MPHHVYANNNEIASKSANGKSIAAAPDVCFTTPPSVAGGTPIPFANTCSAKDISNGSRTVLIKNKEIALENKSYFKKSTGNEPATQAFKKGIISGKIKGKCYFVSWSPNVKVEGLCVTRHMDSVTHNHVNQANTPPNRYRSINFNERVCRKERRRIEKRCRTKSNEDRNQRQAKRGRIAGLLKGVVTEPDDRARQLLGFQRRASNAWIDDYCDGLWVNASALPEGLSQQLEQQKQQLNSLYDEFKDKGIVETVEALSGEVVESVVEHLSDEVGRLVATSIAKVIVKAGIGTAAAGTVVAAPVAVALWAWAAYDIYALKRDVFDQMGDTGMEYLNMLMNPHEIKDKIKEQLDLLSQGSPNQVYGNLQELKANTSPCIKARKCKLVTFNQSKNTQSNRSSGNGCCPGQTGHHLLPDSMFRNPDPRYASLPRNQKPTDECWSGYSEGGSLTMCVEGGASAGSHGKMHTETANAVIDMRGDNSQIEYSEIRDETAEILNDKYGCSKRCIRDQLDEYYGSVYKCGDLDDAKVLAHTGRSGGGPIIRESQGDM